jgi:hypothetical protein
VLKSPSAREPVAFIKLDVIGKGSWTPKGTHCVEGA